MVNLKAEKSGPTVAAYPAETTDGSRSRAKAGRRGELGVPLTPSPEPSLDPDTDDDPLEERAPRPAAAPTSVTLAAAELATAISEGMTQYADLPAADKGTLWAALGLMASTLAPFVGVPGDPWRPGVMAGGWALVLFAVWAVALVRARAVALGILDNTDGDLAAHEDSRLRRISLLQLCCGAAATAYCGYLFMLHVWLMDARTVTGARLTPILRPGLFVACFFATGLAYAGWARFKADAQRRQRRLAE